MYLNFVPLLIQLITVSLKRMLGLSSWGTKLSRALVGFSQGNILLPFTISFLFNDHVYRCEICFTCIVVSSDSTYWRHGLKTLFALLTLSRTIHRSPHVDSSHKGPVNRSVNGFIGVSMNKMMKKNSLIVWDSTKLMCRNCNVVKHWSTQPAVKLSMVGLSNDTYPHVKWRLASFMHVYLPPTAYINN